MSRSVNGQVVAITGAARGIGLATAAELRRRGARVAIGDIDAEEAANAASGLGADVLAAGLDVADPGSFKSFIELVERELGPIDVLINNAGIMPIGPLLDEPPEIARRVVEINVLGVLTGMKLALSSMLPRGHGHIVNVASVAGKSPVPGGETYAASKAAVVSFTESARVEFAGKGISFTCVMPSFTSTDLIAGTKGTKMISSVTPEKVATAIARAVEKGKRDVYVPSSVGAILRAQPLIGRRVRDAMNHMIGADRTFLEVDRRERAPYEERIRGPVPEREPTKPVA